MGAPKCVIETLTALRNERVPLASRLDAIDIAIEQVSRVWGLGGEAQAAISFGNGSQKERRPKPSQPRVVTNVSSDTSEASERRELILQVIGRSEVGLTIAEIRKLLPKITSKDRSNALNTLRLKGQIRRNGNAWVKAA